MKVLTVGVRRSVIALRICCPLFAVSAFAVAWFAWQHGFMGYMTIDLGMAAADLALAAFNWRYFQL